MSSRDPGGLRQSGALHQALRLSTAPASSGNAALLTHHRDYSKMIDSGLVGVPPEQKMLKGHLPSHISLSILVYEDKVHLALRLSTAPASSGIAPLLTHHWGYRGTSLIRKRGCHVG